jgi:hypothetical protein
MDARNDAIVGTACNYNWREFQNYAISLSRSGFKGRKVLFVNNISKVARETLTMLEFELVDYVKVENNAVIQRFKLLHDWLTKEQGSLRYVIHCDVRDVVVQTDPSPWMEKQTAKIFAASECILYKNEICNPAWVEKVYGKTGLAALSNEEVICAGTVAGEAEAIKRLSLRIYQSCQDRFGDDQAVLNHLLRTEFKNEMRIPSPDEGFILTAGWWLIGDVEGNLDRPIGQRSMLRGRPPCLKDGVAYPNGSDIPFCIVHQYERSDVWGNPICLRYRPDFLVENDGPTSKGGFVRIPGAKIKYTGDGMTCDWWDTHARI